MSREDYYDDSFSHLMSGEDPDEVLLNDFLDKAKQLLFDEIFDSENEKGYDLVESSKETKNSVNRTVNCKYKTCYKVFEITI